MQPLALVPNAGVVPGYAGPGRSYGMGPRGVSVIAPADPLSFRSTGFDVNGAWPVNIVDANDTSNMFDRVSPFNTSMPITQPGIYSPDYAPAQNVYQHPGMVPSADTTLENMQRYNQALAAGVVPPQQYPNQYYGGYNVNQFPQQPQYPQAPYLPPQPPQQMYAQPPTQMQFQPNPQVPTQLFPQQVQQQQQQQFQPQMPFPQQAQQPAPPFQFPQQPAPQPQPPIQQQPQFQPAQPMGNFAATEPPALGSSIPGTQKEASEPRIMIEGGGQQMFADAEAILLDDGEASVTLTLVNPDSSITEFSRHAPLDSTWNIRFDSSLVTNVQLNPGPITVPVRNVKMTINDSANNRRMLVFALET